FDVVIGNPPWVRNSRIDAGAKAMLADRYRLFRRDGARDAAAFHQPDLSIAFFERALSLAAPRGVVSLLMPAKVLNAAYAAPLGHRRAGLDALAAAARLPLGGALAGALRRRARRRPRRAPPLLRSPRAPRHQSSLEGSFARHLRSGAGRHAQRSRPRRAAG